jgi:hypothetical protein
MLTAKENIINMIERLPEQQLQKVINYIILIKNEKHDETILTQEQQELLDLLNYTIDTGRVDFSDAQFEIYHDLDILAGTWTTEETQEFLTAIADFNQVDEKLWQ